MISRAEAAQRRALYDAGLNDCEIGEALGIDRTTFAMWRRKQGWPSHRPRVGANVAKLRELYDQGLNDVAIAKASGHCLSVVFRWRQRESLPTNMEGNVTREEDARRRRLHAFGLTDRGLADAIGIDKTTIAEWRRLRGLSPNPVPKEPAAVPTRIYSLDELRYNGTSWHDVRADPSWSNWLEEMGATVW